MTLNLDELAEIQKPNILWVMSRWTPGENEETACSKWLPWEEWKAKRKWMPNYRTVLLREVVLETDYPTKEVNWQVAQKIMEHLRQQGYGYRCYWSGNKSFHIHLFFTNMEVIEDGSETKN